MSMSPLCSLKKTHQRECETHAHTSGRFKSDDNHDSNSNSSTQSTSLYSDFPHSKTQSAAMLIKADLQQHIGTATHIRHLEDKLSQGALSLPSSPPCSQCQTPILLKSPMKGPSETSTDLVLIRH